MEVKTENSSYTFKDLLADSQYKVDVTAGNEAGTCTEIQPAHAEFRTLRENGGEFC